MKPKQKPLMYSVIAAVVALSMHLIYSVVGGSGINLILGSLVFLVTFAVIWGAIFISK